MFSAGQKVVYDGLDDAVFGVGAGAEGIVSIKEPLYPFTVAVEFDHPHREGTYVQDVGQEHLTLVDEDA